MFLENFVERLCLSMQHCETKKGGSVNKCFDLQGFGQRHCEFLFYMVGMYDEMGRLILRVKEYLLSSSSRACWYMDNIALRTVGTGLASGNRHFGSRP